MITNIISDYKLLCKLFDFQKPNCDFSKSILIRMAKEGQEKPKIRTKLGERFYSYIYKNSDCYDYKFVEKIKKIRPDWLITQYNIVQEKKQKLLDMAKNGEPRPKKGVHPLGTSLGTYTNKSQRGSYDPKFTKEIKKIRPDWFVSQTELANQKKKKLLNLAKSGKPRPSFKTELGKFLGERTTKKNLINSEFSKKIRKLRPDWFVTNAQINRQKIIELAKSGGKRPSQRTKMGMHMYDYIKRSAKFKETLKKLRPDWFVTRSQVANLKKQKLLSMAKNGEKRPYNGSLGSCLCNYVGKYSGSYDPLFSKQIRKLRPDWFKK